MVEWKAFLANPKHQYHVSYYRERDCSAQSQKEWRLLWESKFVSFNEWTLILWKMVEGKPFLVELMHKYHTFQWGECDCSARTLKGWRLLWESKFVLFDGWTLVLWKVVERKAFLAKPKYQYHVSQWRKRDCSPQSQKNGDYYGNRNLSHLMDELWL